MNELLIRPENVQLLSRDGIEFKNNTFIELEIDGEPYLMNKAFEDGTVYWPELMSSLIESGHYLIFTCACGIADDAGWEQVKVIHSASEIAWEFERNGAQKFTFEKTNYISQVEKCESLMNLREYPLAVELAVFPEQTRCQPEGKHL